MEPATGIEPASSPYEGAALPLSYAGILVPRAGIEPGYPAYKAGASPLCFPRRELARARSEAELVHDKTHILIRLAFLAPLALAACAHTPEGPRIVEIPVPVACVAKDKLPSEPALIAPGLTGDAVHDLDLVAASNIQLRGWGRSLYAALVACAK